SEHESMVEQLATRRGETPWGHFDAVAYRDRSSGAAHLALIHGRIEGEVETLVRVHAPTPVLDVLLQGDGAHSWSVADALRTIAAAPSGVLILLNCQGSAENVFAHFESWKAPADPAAVPLDRETRYGLRTYGIGAQIMRDLGVGKARLLARPRKMPSMAGFALTITGYISEPPHHP